jgi:hypothetical protein
LNSNPITTKKRKQLLGMVAHVYNPSLSGDRDQEDHGSRTAQQKH